MKEHPQAEVQLTIRKHGIVLSVDDEHGGLSPVAVRVLRALELGGPPPLDGEFHIYACRKCGRSSPEDDNGDLRCGHSAPEPTAKPDDEALTQALFNAYITHPSGNPAESMGAVLAHLRAQGLMRTAEDAQLASDLKSTRLALRAKDESLEELGGKFDAAQAQVRALTAKCEEANAAFDAADVALRKCRNDLATTEHAYQRERTAREAAEKRAHEAGQEAVRIGEVLLDAKKTIETLAGLVKASRELGAERTRERDEAEKALAMLREQAEADKKRIAALEVVNEEVQSNNEALRGSELQAKAAMDG